jgi:hypothetical protein
MDGEKYAMVAPWMENGNIVEFLREDLQVNPLKLARTMFYFTHLFIESGHSWRTPHVVFNISIAWTSHTVT